MYIYIYVLFMCIYLHIYLYIFIEYIFMHMCIWAFLIAQHIKNSPARQETQETRVRALVQEDTLEEEMATHSSILAWKIPLTEEPGGL